MNNTSNPKRLAIRIRDGAQVIYKLGLKLRGFAAIGPFVFGIVLIIGLVIWDAKMLNQVKSENRQGLRNWPVCNQMGAALGYKQARVCIF